MEKIILVGKTDMVMAIPAVGREREKFATMGLAPTVFGHLINLTKSVLAS